MRPQVIVTATVLLNAVLFVVNLVVAIRSGSHAVLSQAVFTITDLLGALMIFWGFVSSQRPPDHNHPFGRGKERFFWAFAAILVTFTIAGLIILVSGFGQIVDPQPVQRLGEALLTVGITTVASVIGILVTLREVRVSRTTVWNLISSAHMGIKTVFFQDLVGVVGGCTAFVGIFLVYRTHNEAIDGIAACAVGVLTAGTGFLLAAETREFLIGKAITPGEARDILLLVERDPRVRQVRSLQSMVLGPDEFLLALRVNFQDGLTTDQIELVIDQLSLALRHAHPKVRHLLVEPDS